MTLVFVTAGRLEKGDQQKGRGVERQTRTAETEVKYNDSALF